MNNRVLQVVGSLDIGGAETVLLNLCRILEPDQVEHFEFLVFGEQIGTYENELKDLGFVIHHAPKPSMLNPNAFLKFMKDLVDAGAGYSTVHSHVNFASGLILSTARQVGIPNRIAHSHMTGSFREAPHRRLYNQIARRRVRRNATQRLACSSEAGRFLFGSGWDATGAVVPNGVDTRAFREARSSRESMRESLGISGDEVAVGVVARLSSVKNIGYLVSLMSRDSSRAPFRLVVAGTGPEELSLKGQAESLGVASRILWLGQRRDIPQLMAALDVLAMPSHSEGLPVSLLEAQAAGLPSVVSTNVTDEAKVVAHLVRRASLDAPDDWLTALYSQADRRADAESVDIAFRHAGFRIEDQLRSLSSAYGWSET